MASKSNDTDSREMERAATNRLADKAHQTIDRAAEVAGDAEESVRSTTARAARRLKSSEERAAATVDDGIERVRGYVEKNPFATAGIAFAAGIVVSVLLRR